MQEQIHEVVPVVVQSAACAEQSVVALALSVLLRVCPDPASMRDHLTAHAHSLVPRLVRTAVLAPDSATRARALQLLTAMSRLPFQRVIAFRTLVQKGLVPALDDRKRVVRRWAAKCRNAWAIMVST